MPMPPLLWTCLISYRSEMTSPGRQSAAALVFPCWAVLATVGTWGWVGGSPTNAPHWGHLSSWLGERRSTAQGAEHFGHFMGASFTGASLGSFLHFPGAQEGRPVDSASSVRQRDRARHAV